MSGLPSTTKFTTIEFDQYKNRITILDQTRLPWEEVYVQLFTVDDVFQAIRTMKVRGAPLIGITAAYGIALASQNMDRQAIYRVAEYLATARPTAVNLTWAINRMKRAIDAPLPLHDVLVQEARNIELEDKAACRRIGENGASCIPDNSSVMVHCNTGALATSGIGTALGIVYTAVAQGKTLHVYATETRPRLQGGRLTAWELTRNGIDTCVICDTMAATYIPSMSAVLVGADRIAANGDTANKVGTCGLAILARYYRIPFYVAAPASTFDMQCTSSAQIPVEFRDEQEVRQFSGLDIVPQEARVVNPSFDITPAGLITAFITERGIINRPFKTNIRNTIEQSAKKDH